MKQYNDNVLEHFWQPHNVGHFAADATNVATGTVGVAGVGDMLQLQLQIEQNRIIAAKFKVYGNPYLIAGCSLITEKLPGLTIEQAQQIKHSDFVADLHLPKTKYYCALLLEDVIKAAINAYHEGANNE